MVLLVASLLEVSSWCMIARFLLGCFSTEEFLVLFGVFMACINIYRAGFLQCLDCFTGSWFLSALVQFGTMLEMIWCDGCPEVV